MHSLRQLTRMLFMLILSLILSACRNVSVQKIITTTPLPTTISTPTIPPNTATPVNTPAGQVTPARITIKIPMNNPASLVAADERIWVVSGASIVQFDPETNQEIGQPIRAGISFDGDIAISEDQIWVSSVSSGDLGVENDRDAVMRIDPLSGETVATVAVSRGPLSLAVTAGKVWVVNFGAAGDSVTRIDERTNQITGGPIRTGRAPISLASGDGSVWVANHDARTVTRIDSESGLVLASIDVPSEPHRIAFGDGFVWVSNWPDLSVTQIDPATNQVIGEPIELGHPSGNIAIGFGSVWVTSDYRVDGDPQDVVLIRIDVKTRQLLETIPLGGHPIDVAVSAHAVWVTVQNPDQLVRIDP